MKSRSAQSFYTNILCQYGALQTPMSFKGTRWISCRHSEADQNISKGDLQAHAGLHQKWQFWLQSLVLSEADQNISKGDLQAHAGLHQKWQFWLQSLVLGESIFYCLFLPCATKQTQAMLAKTSAKETFGVRTFSSINTAIEPN